MGETVKNRAPPKPGDVITITVKPDERLHLVETEDGKYVTISPGEFKFMVIAYNEANQRGIGEFTGICSEGVSHDKLQLGFSGQFISHALLDRKESEPT